LIISSPAVCLHRPTFVSSFPAFLFFFRTDDFLLDAHSSHARDGHQPNVVNEWPDAAIGIRRARFTNGKTVRLARARHNNRDLGPNTGLFGSVGRFLAIPGKNGSFTRAVEYVVAGPNVEASLVLLVHSGLDVLVDMIKLATLAPIELQKVVAVNGRDAFETFAIYLDRLAIHRLPSLNFVEDLPPIVINLVIFKRAVVNEICSG
jgi:hypothetical protein